MIADCFKDHYERSKALGIAITSLALGSFMSVPFSGFLFEYVSKKAPFIVLALLALLVLVLLLVNIRSNYYLYSNHANGNGGSSETKQKTPIWSLFLDPYIAVCAMAIMMANVPLAFTEPAIAVWMKKTMNSTESQIGLIWLSGFVPHLTGVYFTVFLIKRYAQHQFLFIIVGLLLEALSVLWLPFIDQYYVLFVPIMIICFGYGLIDATILPTMAYLVDTRHVSVYGSVYAIVDISYSIVYAFGPMITGIILNLLNFAGLSICICVIMCVYTPFVLYLRKIYKLKAFQDAENAGKSSL
jgi:DHA1 family vesicular acetylcholine transporter-like MFS transporter 3